MIWVVLWATHSLPGEPGTGVLWVLTWTHPCDTPRPGRMMGASERQPLLALDCARGELACVIVRAVVPDGGGFVVLHCLSSRTGGQNFSSLSGATFSPFLLSLGGRLFSSRVGHFSDSSRLTVARLVEKHHGSGAMLLSFVFCKHDS